VKIDKPSQVTSTSTARRSGGSASARPGEFARFLDQPGGPSAVSGGNPISSVDALLAAQSVDATGEEGRRQARQRGEDILNRLDDLRHGLLAGTLSRSQLLSLRNIVRSRRGTVMDPKLSELLDEIELRAEVEIAKLSAADSSLD
jgi:hypothetical protein